METLNRPYKIGLGTAQCTNCGAGIRKHYIALNSHKPICSNCVNEVFSMTITKEELSVPMKLIDLADKYMYRRLYLEQYRGEPIRDVNDFVLGFFKYPNGVVNIALVNETYLAEGKVLKNGWVEATKHHLQERYVGILKDVHQPQRKLLVCGNCMKPLYFKGVKVYNNNRQYHAYKCLSGKSCANCNSKLLVLYSPQENRIVGRVNEKGNNPTFFTT